MNPLYLLFKPYYIMNKLLYTLIICLAFAHFSSGQISSVSASKPLAVYGDGINMKMMDIPPLPQDLDHSLYLEDEWLPGSVLFENDRILEKCSLKYDIANGYVEIKGEKSVKAAPERDVKQFTFTQNEVDRWFMSASLFNNSDKISQKLLEVLVSGEVKLLFLSEVEIIKPNGGFTDQRRAGADAITSMKKEKYYLVQNEALATFDTKKQMYKAFGNQLEPMKEWIKSYKLKLNDQDDLKRIVIHYSDLQQAG